MVGKFWWPLAKGRPLHFMKSRKCQHSMWLEVGKRPGKFKQCSNKSIDSEFWVGYNWWHGRVGSAGSLRDMDSCEDRDYS